MHSDIVLENVLLKDSFVISEPWIAPLVVAWWRSWALGMAGSVLMRQSIH